MHALRRVVGAGCSALRARRLGLLAAAALATAALLYLLRIAFLPLAVAGVLAYLLSGPVRWLERHGHGRARATVITFLAFALLVLLTGMALAPSISREASQLLAQLPEIGRGLQRSLGQYDRSLTHASLPAPYRQAAATLLESAESRVVSFMQGIVRSVLNAAPSLLSLFIAPWIAFFLVRDGRRVRHAIFSLVPMRWHEELREWLRRCDAVLAGFLRGQMIVAAVVGMLAFSVMTAFGLGYGVLVGLLAGLTDAVPLVGPFIGALPAVLVASTRSMTTAGWVALAFLLIHETEGNILEPLLVGEQMGIHPVTLVLALLAGGELGGVFGILVAAPLAGILSATVQVVSRRLLRPRALR